MILQDFLNRINELRKLYPGIENLDIVYCSENTIYEVDMLPTLLRMTSEAEENGIDVLEGPVDENDVIFMYSSDLDNIRQAVAICIN